VAGEFSSMYYVVMMLLIVSETSHRGMHMNLREEFTQRIMIEILKVVMEMTGLGVNGVLEMVNRDLTETVNTNLTGIMSINHIEAMIVSEEMIVTGLVYLNDFNQI
jgi:hypothetical protein